MKRKMKGEIKKGKEGREKKKGGKKETGGEKKRRAKKEVPQQGSNPRPSTLQPTAYSYCLR